MKLLDLKLEKNIHSLAVEFKIALYVSTFPPDTTRLHPVATVSSCFDWILFAPFSLSLSGFLPHKCAVSISAQPYITNRFKIPTDLYEFPTAIYMYFISVLCHSFIISKTNPTIRFGILILGASNVETMLFGKVQKHHTTFSLASVRKVRQCSRIPMHSNPAWTRMCSCKFHTPNWKLTLEEFQNIYVANWYRIYLWVSPNFESEHPVHPKLCNVNFYIYVQDTPEHQKNIMSEVCMWKCTVVSSGPCPI